MNAKALLLLIMLLAGLVNMSYAAFPGKIATSPAAAAPAENTSPATTVAKQESRAHKFIHQLYDPFHQNYERYRNNKRDHSGFGLASFLCATLGLLTSGVLLAAAVVAALSGVSVALGLLYTSIVVLIICSVLAVIFGILGLGAPRNKGFAIAGLIIGGLIVLGLALSL